ncbi:NAD(+) kinase [Natronospirillum operosum]|uniref:NAD kinase n=1 Tax=Natronospirillum operosum TaxID=2759953 RepID=A0A4Z0WIS4_9GAMM|nr:NAD(+) kinase [Natronospirillum operosum]TGG95726.1 NAD(+) kinase [Natronospirillum operosum]
MATQAFHHIAVLGRLGSDSVRATLHRLQAWLQAQGRSCRFESSLVEMLPADTPAELFADQALLGQWADLIIVVGGDGTLLGAARDMARFERPMLGINRGRLGFLTDIMPDDLETEVSAVLDGRYLLEHRFLLEAVLERDGVEIGRETALNDVVLHPGQSIRMIEFDLYVDEHFVYRQRSDGLIVSTPTGSTAYALSAGGPIMQPGLDAISLVPMFPHSLTSRPLMIDGNARIRIDLGASNEESPHVACDAQKHMQTRPGDRLHIGKHQHRLHLLHPQQHNYYEICRTKLGWGSRLGDDTD